MNYCSNTNTDGNFNENKIKGNVWYRTGKIITKEHQNAIILHYNTGRYTVTRISDDLKINRKSIAKYIKNYENYENFVASTEKRKKTILLEIKDLITRGMLFLT